jgi:hypothetical protein
VHELLIHNSQVQWVYMDWAFLSLPPCNHDFYIPFSHISNTHLYFMCLALQVLKEF